MVALSVTFGDTSPIGRGTGVPVRPTRDEQSLRCPETVVPCGLDSQQLDKVRLSRSRCPRKRGPLFCALSGFRRPAQSGPARQWLPLWGSWREAPERARPLPENHKHGDSIALTEGLLIAASRLSGDGLALSVTFGDTSPIGRGFRHPRATQVIWQSSQISAYQRRKTNFAKVANLCPAGKVGSLPIRGTSPRWRTTNI